MDAPDDFEAFATGVIPKLLRLTSRVSANRPDAEDLAAEALFVSNLQPNVFGVRENGSAQKIDLVARESIPTNLLLLVDNSQSMGRRMDFVRAAADRLAKSLRENDRAIVAPFNAHIGTITGKLNGVIPATTPSA